MNHEPNKLIKRVGILNHPKKPESQVLAQEMANFVHEQGCEPWVSSAWDEPQVTSSISSLDLLVTLGGDGTILRAARMGARFGAPLLGVKMGRLGFLAEIQPESWQEPLARCLAGQYWLEQRMMLDVRVDRIDGSESVMYEALNDVVASRGNLARMVRAVCHLDDDYLTTYAADGVIVATATGATGYAFAVGGPIVPPELHNILLVAIAPHLSLDRAIVLSEGVTVKLQLYSDHQAILTVDGQFEIGLCDGDTVSVRASPHVARFVRLRDRGYFYRTLMERLRANL